MEKLNSSFVILRVHLKLPGLDKGTRVKIPDGTAAVSAENQRSLTKVSHWETGKAELDWQITHLLRRKSEDLQKSMLPCRRQIYFAGKRLHIVVAVFNCTEE